MKNPEFIVTVDNQKHGAMRVKPNPDFVHAKDQNLIAITLSELTGCAANFPIVFIKNPENGATRPVVMFGLRPGENVYYGKDGWDCTYVPLIVQRHPFAIGLDDREPEDSRELTTCLDKNSPFLSEVEGIAMFTPAGEDTDFLVSRKQLLSAIFEGEKITDQFTKKIVELDLLMPFEMILQPLNGEVRKVTGMFTVDERKLRELAPEVAQELHKLDYLPACYLIFGSLFQMHNLMKLRNRKSDEQVNYRMELDPQPEEAVQPQG